MTATDCQRRRHSLDLRSLPAATTPPIFASLTRENIRRRGSPRPTLATAFEVVIDATVFRVDGRALQRRIVKRRGELNVLKGMLFKQRPMLE